MLDDLKKKTNPGYLAIGRLRGLTLVEKINVRNYFFIRDSVYLFNENKKIFYADNSDQIVSVYYKLNDNNTIISLQQDNLGRIWMTSKAKVTMGMLQENGSWKWISSPFTRFGKDVTLNKLFEITVAARANVICP